MTAPTKPTARKSSAFYWWRRFPTPKYNKKLPLLQRIINGEFDPSPFIKQADWELEWMEQDIGSERKHYRNSNSIAFIDEVVRKKQTVYLKRHKRLTEDSWADEDRRLKEMVSAFRKEFKLPADIIREFISYFEGNVMECYEALDEFCSKHNPKVIHEKHIKSLYR